MRYSLTIIFIITFITACSPNEIKKYDGGELNFNSNDWLKDQYKKYRANPLNVEINIKPITTKRFMVNMEMKGDPVHPLNGINPTALSIFSLCVFNYVSSSNGQPAWVFGLRENDVSSTKRNQLVIIGTKEELEIAEKDPNYKWFKPTLNTQVAGKCGKLIKEEYTL